MSRTDKDRPYWVKTQDEGVPHHDHTRLGAPIYHINYLTDEDDNKVMERVPFYKKACEIIAKYAEVKRPGMFDWSDYTGSFSAYGVDGYYHYFRKTSDKVQFRNEGEVFEDAFNACEFGDPNRMILAGTYERQVRERYIAGYVQDHCTIDEMEPRNPRGIGVLYGQYPCYKTFSNSPTFRCSCEMCNPGVNYAGVRAAKRDTLRKMTKAYNSGDEDWEDAFDRDNITPSRKSFQSWW